MIGRVALIVRPILDRTRRHVGLATDDRLHPRILRRLVKFNRTEKISVIGYRHRWHPEFRDLFHQLRHSNRTVEERVLRMQVEMNEGVGRHPAAV